MTLALQQVLRDHIIGPAHVGFIVPDMQAALQQFKRLYGLADADIKLQPPLGETAATRFAFFNIAGLEFELIEPVSDEFKRTLLEMPSGGAGINHVAWQVDDIVAAVALLARQGINPGHVTPQGIVDVGAKKMVYLNPADTGGLIVELIEIKAPGA